jgi:hypothetical protein
MYRHHSPVFIGMEYSPYARRDDGCTLMHDLTGGLENVFGLRGCFVDLSAGSSGAVHEMIHVQEMRGWMPHQFSQDAAFEYSPDEHRGMENPREQQGGCSVQVWASRRSVPGGMRCYCTRVRPRQEQKPIVTAPALGFVPVASFLIWSNSCSPLQRPTAFIVSSGREPPKDPMKERAGI